MVRQAPGGSAGRKAFGRANARVLQQRRSYQQSTSHAAPARALRQPAERRQRPQIQPRTRAVLWEGEVGRQARR